MIMTRITITVNLMNFIIIEAFDIIRKKSIKAQS